ncbi:Hypothetical predicted protein [Mytilus galloprovincialis]|uniref:Reverse transcriptase domain-containing protein n=1 Tax=Mytilus galloprovincialis TaxID=29158 RepID=A0A8B6BLZ8_MYTGA|nr:Hypothetical predicted protein [Mytilus galloprovincialis]
MKEKTDRNKQLAEVLPDNRRVTLGSQLGKKNPTATVTSESTFVKKPKFDSNFKIPKKNFGEFKSSGKQTQATKPWEWESITDDQWVLKTLQEGLKLEFQETPHLTALCFGPSQAPRVFTKIFTVVAAHLRIQNTRLATYLDDWLLVNSKEKMLILDREKPLSHLIKLRFIINLKKSSLIPSQEITYIGALFNCKKEKVSPTMERILK